MRLIFARSRFGPGGDLPIAKEDLMLTAIESSDPVHRYVGKAAMEECAFK
jgi:hypothetical protein